MSRGFANFIRIMGFLLAIGEVVAAVAMDSNSLVFFLSLFSAAFILFLALQYAKHVDTTVEHDDELIALSVKIQQLEAQLSNRQPAQPEQSPENGQTVSRGKFERTLPEKKQPSVEPIPLPEDPEHVSCPCCGDVQRSNRTRCKNCGVSFLVK